MSDYELETMGKVEKAMAMQPSSADYMVLDNLSHRKRQARNIGSSA